MSDTPGKLAGDTPTASNDEIKMIVLEDSATSNFATGQEQPPAQESNASLTEIFKYLVVFAIIGAAGYYGYKERHTILDKYARAENGFLEPDPPPELLPAKAGRAQLLTSLLQDPMKKAVVCIRPIELFQTKAFQDLPGTTKWRLKRLLEEMIGVDVAIDNIEEVVIVNENGATKTTSVVTTKSPIDLEEWKKTKHLFEKAGQANVYHDKIPDGRRMAMTCVLNPTTLILCNRVDHLHDVVLAAMNTKITQEDLDLPKGLMAIRIPDLSKNASAANRPPAGGGGSATGAVQEVGPKTNLDTIRYILRFSMVRWTNSIKGIDASLVADKNLRLDIQCTAKDASKAFAMTDVFNEVKSRFMTFVVTKATPEVPKAFDFVNPVSATQFKIDGATAKMSLELDAKFLEALVQLLPKEHRRDAEAPKS